VVIVSAYAVYSAGVKVKILDRQAMDQKRFQKQLTAADYSFMNRAVALSGNGQPGTGTRSVGAVVVVNGKVVGEGFGPVSSVKDPSAHAEMLAIRQASESLSRSTLKGAYLYVSEQPCPMCLSLMYLSQVEKIYYNSSSAENSINRVDFARIRKALAVPPDQRPIPEIPMSINNAH
jgi:tRNA(Arg) A34 adenosine deaminase TadA